MAKLSIIIPVYNNWNYTEKCLESVFRHTEDDTDDFEVVVVDDNSKDGTFYHINEFRSKHENLLYLRNEENLGFSGTCNRGAANASGEYLIFLNNDTIVTEQWAGQLLNTISANRDIWMAGARCLYPDGTLQHAGVAFPEHFRYHLGHIYRSAPGCFPLANYEKDYQCVTAACMIIRKEDFDELEGFDTAYRNGFEDVDLCLRIIKKGKRIRYQPGCTIIHYESKSESRFDKMKENKRILLERWEDFVRHDEAEHVNTDLKNSIKAGRIQKVASCNFKNKGDLCQVKGSYRKKGKKISFLPAENGNEISIHVPETDELRDYLLITGRTTSEKAGRIHLKYRTKHDDEFSEIKSFTFRTYTGENIFYFPVFRTFLNGEFILDFSGNIKDVLLEKLEIYTFDNCKKREKPVLTAIIYGKCNKDYVRNFMSNMAERTDDYSLIQLHALCYNGGVPDEADSRLSGKGVDFSYTKCKIEELSSELNRIIKESKTGYLYVTPDIVHIEYKDIADAVEVMETDPEIGMFFGINEVEQKDGRPDTYASASLLSETLSGTRDLPAIFRKSAWEDAGGYSEGLEYYFNNDLCLSILSKANWRSYFFPAVEDEAQPDNEHLPLETYTRLKYFQQQVKRKHADFLLTLYMNGTSPQNNKVIRYYGQRYHDTLMGSLKVHFNHFIRRRILRRKPKTRDSHS